MTPFQSIIGSEVNSKLSVVLQNAYFHTAIQKGKTVAGNPRGLGLFNRQAQLVEAQV